MLIKETFAEGYEPAAKDPKEEKVRSVLDELGIDYSICRHTALFTCDDAWKEGYTLPGLNLKNLLLKDKKTGRRYLVIMGDDHRLDLKKYREVAGWSGKISFAGDDDLAEYLGVTTGACSVFGIVNDENHEVVVVFEKLISDAPDGEFINFHPNINTATLTMTVGDMRRFVKHMGNPVIYE